MPRSRSLFASICACALSTLSGCSGCQQVAPKPDSAPRENTTDAAAPVSKTADTAAAEADEQPKPISPDESSSSEEVTAAESPAEASADAQEADAAGANPTPNSPQTAEKPGKTAKAPAVSPAEARSAAQAALRESAKLAAAGDDAGAYQTALAGWEAARRGPSDLQLKRLTAQLLVRVKQSGEAVTVKVPADTDKASVLE